MRVWTVFGLFYCLLCTWNPCNGQYARYTPRRMRHKLYTMDQQLIMDSIMKRVAINYMKHYYENSPEYQLADVVYKIRRQYARMVFVFLRTLEYFKDFSKYKFMDNLREIQGVGMTVDNMINMMEQFLDRNTRQKRITRTGAALRSKLLENSYIGKVRSNNERGNSHQLNNILTQKQNLQRQAENDLTKKQKQRAYVERKKIAWSMARGIPRTEIKRADFQKRDKIEDGFDTE